MTIARGMMIPRGIMTTTMATSRSLTPRSSTSWNGRKKQGFPLFRESSFIVFFKSFLIMSFIYFSIYFSSRQRAGVENLKLFES